MWSSPVLALQGDTIYQWNCGDYPLFCPFLQDRALVCPVAHFERYCLYHLLIYSKVSCPEDVQGESPLKGQGNVGDNSHSALSASIQ